MVAVVYGCLAHIHSDFLSRPLCVHSQWSLTVLATVLAFHNIEKNPEEIPNAVSCSVWKLRNASWSMALVLVPPLR
jgi:hypothetical protein